MKYAVDTDSVAMIYIPSLIKIGLEVQNFMGGGYTDTDRMEILYAYLRKVG
jgi:hypothetical protein